MSAHYGPNIVTDGLIVMLDPFNHLNYPGTGTTFSDIVGTSVGTLSNVTVIDGREFEFDGSISRITFVDTMPDNIFDGGATSEAWVQAGSAGENDQGVYVSKLQSSFVDGGWQFGGSLSGGEVRLRLLSNYDSNVFFYWETLTYRIPLDTWTHIVWTFDDSSISNDPIVYVNGVLQTLDTKVTGNTPTDPKDTDAASPLIIGDRGNSDRSWDGKVGMVSFYDRILTIDEARQNFHALKGRFGL
jgi:hypothetical protein